jgi:hypothetical protein
MIETHAWRATLDATHNGEHIAEVYDTVPALAQPVSHFVRSGLKSGESAVLIVSTDHWMTFQAQLEDDGLDVVQARSEGRLVILNAEDCLSKFMDEDQPQWGPFRSLIRPVLDSARAASPIKKVRAFGEMVDILWQQKNLAGAHRLEQFWNDLNRLIPFSLFCAYRMDIFDEATYDKFFGNICRTHTHVFPSTHHGMLETAVAAATEEVLGTSLAGMCASMHSSVDDLESTRIPAIQRQIMWLVRNLPISAGKILARSRALFELPVA